MRAHWVIEKERTMQFPLTAEEATLLTRVLESALGELRVEVRRTDTRSVHDELKRDEEQIRDLLERLHGAVQQGC
jgi:hypothetical protein